MHLSLLNEKAKKIDGIEKAIRASDYDSLRAYGIQLDKDSPVFRNEVVDELKKKEAFWQTELRVWALLIILATILFGMKFMQPKSLRLYYSSQLQEKWNLFCLGKFDLDLPEMERRALILSSHDALPETFESMMIYYFSNKSILGLTQNIIEQ